jgi:hypothetical protein
MSSNNTLDIQITTGNEKHVLANEEFNGTQIISGKSKHVSLNFNALVKLDNISFEIHRITGTCKLPTFIHPTSYYFPKTIVKILLMYQQ